MAGGRLTIDVTRQRPEPDERRCRLSAPSGERFGLRSVRERLRGHFGDAASFCSTRDEARGRTIARIEMPEVDARPASGTDDRRSAGMIRAVLVDDEPPARARLRQLLSEAAA